MYGAERFVCSSGGNAGLAAAYAARAIGAPMTVVLPSTTPVFMRDRALALGATVVAVGFPFLKAAMAYYKSLGVTVTRVMTDNGSCYKAFAFRDACRDLGIKHIRTKPYTPKTNGKAERFIQTALREWAYAQAYPTSDRRAEELPVWLHRYNWHRPHGGIKSKTPISRLGLTEDNLLRLHI